MGICWKCGKTIDVNARMIIDFGWESREDGRWFCADCYRSWKEEHDLDRAEYARLKKKLMFERAVTTLENAVDIYKYKEIIDDMEEYVQKNPEKFDSSHEIIAAIIFVSLEVRALPNYKIDRYRADFYLPDFKAIVEIDGDRHEFIKEKDTKRDVFIRQKLGLDWEVVRIPTIFLEENPERLLDAVIEVKDERQRIRKKNGGVLPVWYTGKAKKPRKKVSEEEFL